MQQAAPAAQAREAALRITKAQRRPYVSLNSAFGEVAYVVTGEAIGNLYYNFASSRRFRRPELDFARRLGASLSLAMDNARLFGSERSNARINEALAAIDESIHGTLDRDEMLRLVAAESAEEIGADSTVLAMREGEEWVVRYGEDLAVDVIGQGFTVEQAPFMGIAAETGQPVAIDDAWNDPRASPETQHYLGVRSVMFAPLIHRDEVVGGRRSESECFSIQCA